VIELGLPAGPLNVLCLGAHPDDIEIGCGGTLLSIGAVRDLTARLVILTGTEERRVEAANAVAAFVPGAELEMHRFPDGRLPAHWNSVKETLELVAATFRPDVIFAPRRDDAHQDHRLVAELVGTVWRDVLVLRYEIPKWDGDMGRVTHYVPVSDERALRKVQLLDKSFPSQAGRDWWDEETFFGLLRLRGIECRSHYAEGFVLDKAQLAF
jgi:LmbE family N-acetylglucosaminyl deacetylase